MITMTTMPMMPMMMRRGCGRLRILSAIVVAMLMMFSPVYDEVGCLGVGVGAG
jgi:hypothetical protein